MNKKTRRIKIFQKGFTLIELLIVIGVMAILTTVVFVALNPAGRFQDSRNARRWTDVNAILTAIKLDQVDNGGYYLDPEIETDLTDDTYYQIGESTLSDCADTCSNPTITLQATCVDLLDLVTEGYLSDVPIDPYESTATSDNTGYYLYKFSSGQMLVGSCFEEQGTAASIPTIEVSR